MVLKRNTSGGIPDRILTLAGNPNVGKSTVFNALTGLHQHTGNWPGKTVGSAEGRFRHRGESILLVDTPGAYSLCAHSAEEEVTRDYLCFGNADAVIVVLDATALSRSLHLALQVLETSRHVVLCVNLMDEAQKRGLCIDLARMEQLLGAPCVGVSARAGRGLSALADTACRAASSLAPVPPARVRYPEALESVLRPLADVLLLHLGDAFLSRAAAVRLISGDVGYLAGLEQRFGLSLRTDEAVNRALRAARAQLAAGTASTETADCSNAPGKKAYSSDASHMAALSGGDNPRNTGFDEENAAHAREAIASALYAQAEAVSSACVTKGTDVLERRQMHIDRFLTGRWTGLPVMLLGLAAVLYLTIVGANAPSTLLMRALFAVQDLLLAFFALLDAPEWLSGIFILGAYRTLAWVVAVMLPPMAIFFPLFTLLEDLGYLPRVAFNLDHRFCRCRACGKQALTMWMVDSGMRRVLEALPAVLQRRPRAVKRRPRHPLRRLVRD